MRSGDGITVASVAVGGVVSVAVSPERWDLFDSMIGLLLLFVLIGYGDFKTDGTKSPAEAIALSSVIGFCLMLVVGPIIFRLKGDFGLSENQWFAMSWVVLSLLSFAFVQRDWVARLQNK